MTQIQFPTKAQADAAYAPITGIPESAVTNLTTDLAAKAPLVSPALTGTPTVPTAAALTGGTQAASCGYADAAVAASGGSTGISQTQMLMGFD